MSQVLRGVSLYLVNSIRSHKLTKGVLLTVPWVVCFFGLVSFLRHRANPLAQYGVHIEWRDAGATPAYPWIEVWCDHRGERIGSPMLFGGMAYPELSFRDLDGDEIPDIVFSEGKFRQVLAFKPPAADRAPRFVVIENNPTMR